MKQLVIISGKGGTGKTVLSASFAVLARSKVMVDCDVDAANLYLLLNPEIQERHRFSAGHKARLDEEKCTGCGECLEVCRFSAIEKNAEDKIVIDPISCEGCGVCFHICPAEAIDMEMSISGDWYASRTKYGPFVHARLGIGEENSGKLVTEVRNKAQEISEQSHLDYVIIDGPPGIGCPVIASLSGTDLALVVTEPTVSGVHDMERVIQMAHHFKTKTTCCINKFDLNLAVSNQIEDWCSQNSVPLVGRIPYDEVVTKSVVQGIPLPEYSDNSVSREIHKIWHQISKLLNLEDR
jgi:MinD superfamily P-loop ATPase